LAHIFCSKGDQVFMKI